MSVPVLRVRGPASRICDQPTTGQLDRSGTGGPWSGGYRYGLRREASDE